MRYGADLSHWNQVDWSKLKTDFVIYKCTEATTYLDPTYAKARKNWKGIFGAYHFARGGDPIKESDWFLKNADADIYILDWEIEHPDPVKWCTQFINRLKEKGKFVWFYTNDARACKYAWPKDWIFWIARYGKNDGTQNRKPDFKNWSAWQYTSNGTCPGVVGRVDLSVAQEWAFPESIHPTPESIQTDGITDWLETHLPPPVETSPTPQILPQEEFKLEIQDTLPPISPQPNFWLNLWELIKKLFV